MLRRRVAVAGRGPAFTAAHTMSAADGLHGDHRLELHVRCVAGEDKVAVHLNFGDGQAVALNRYFPPHRKDGALPAAVGSLSVAPTIDFCVESRVSIVDGIAAAACKLLAAAAVDPSMGFRVARVRWSQPSEDQLPVTFSRLQTSDLRLALTTGAPVTFLLLSVVTYSSTLWAKRPRQALRSSQIEARSGSAQPRCCGSVQ